MEFSLKGKVAIITGGTYGLGNFFTKELLKNGLKAVVFTGRDEEKGASARDELQKEFGDGSCEFIKADVSNEKEFEDVFKFTLQTYKQLDILINNAGVLAEMKWKKCVDINLGGCIIGTQLAMDKYLANHHHEAVIVNVASVAGLEASGDIPIYTATKHGIIAMSRAYGVKEHYARTKVRVLAICPGATETPMLSVQNSDSLNVNFINCATLYKDNYYVQGPEYVAKALVDILKKGSAGSVWVVEDDMTYEVKFPNRFAMRKQ